MPNTIPASSYTLDTSSLALQEVHSTLHPGLDLNTYYKSRDGAGLVSCRAGVVNGGVGGGGVNSDSQSSTSGPPSFTVEYRQLQCHPGEEDSVPV